MKQNKIEEGRFSQKARGLGTVTEEMVRKRARELALISGRDEKQMLDSDLAQARRELTGEQRLTPEQGCHRDADCASFCLVPLDPGLQARARKDLLREPADHATFERVR